MNISQKFKDLLAPLNSDEKAGLESSIRAEGCRDPLVVWQEEDTLIDGHNRYEICTRLGVEYDVVYLNFASEHQAYNWIIANQLGRRNVTPEQASYLRGKRYEAEKKTPQTQQQENQYTKVAGGHNVPPPKTSEILADEYKVSGKTIKRDAEFANRVDTIGETLGDDVKQDILSRGSGFSKADVKRVADIIEDEPENARAVIDMVKRGEAKNVQEATSKVMPHVARNNGNNEWYTPPEYIQAARDVMGDIDLDPASSDIANKTVKAKVYFTAESDGLQQEWRGRVWLNPPYASDLIGLFIERLSEEYEAGGVTEFLVLVNNATETRWFQSLAEICDGICFPKGRVRFLDTDGNPGAPLQGQAVLYAGKNVDAFKIAFDKFGITCEVYGG